MSTTSISQVRGAQQRRTRRVVLGLALLLVCTFIIAMCVGDLPVAPLGVLQALLSRWTGMLQPGTDFIILGVRLPRALMAVLSGAAFGLSGTVFQTILRNPLASPDLLGISTGASAGAVLAIIALGWTGAPVSFAAFGGALLTAVAIYLLAWRDGVSPFRIVLIGIGMAAILMSFISFLFTRARLSTVQTALTWLAGSLNGTTMAQVMPLALAMLVLVPLALVAARPLAALQLGDDVARALGARAEASRIGLMLVAVALTAFAAAAVGPIAFVAFMSGPIARRLLGSAGTGLVAACLVGANVTLLADFVAQHLLGNSQLPVGVVTGACGAVFLIWLLVVSSRAGRAA